MKTLALFALFFVAVLAGQTEKAGEALQHCVQEKHFDADVIKGHLKEDLIPENDSVLNDFFKCYWEELGLLEDDGDLDYEKVEAMTPHVLKQKYPNISDADKVVHDGIKHCKDSVAHEDNHGLYAIKYRNCLTKFAQTKLH